MTKQIGFTKIVERCVEERTNEILNPIQMLPEAKMILLHRLQLPRWLGALGHQILLNFSNCHAGWGP